MKMNCPFKCGDVCLWASKVAANKPIRPTERDCSRCLKAQEASRKRKGFQSRRTWIVEQMAAKAISKSLNCDWKPIFEHLQTESPNWKRRDITKLIEHKDHPLFKLLFFVSLYECSLKDPETDWVGNSLVNYLKKYSDGSIFPESFCPSLKDLSSKKSFFKSISEWVDKNDMSLLDILHKFQYPTRVDTGDELVFKDGFKVLTNLELAAASSELTDIVKDKGYTGIVGIPRSGLVTASIIATNLNLPLYSVTNNSDSENADERILQAEIVKLCFSSKNGGLRMQNFNPSRQEKLLAVDDSAGSGRSAHKVKQAFNDIDVAVCFSTSKGSRAIDHYARILEDPHIFEWNFFAGPLIEITGFDIDGVMCPNVPYEICLDEEKYVEYLTNVRTLKYIPTCHKFKVHSIITGRLERYRSITEKWLDKNGVVYNDLIMVPNELEKQRDEDHFNFVGKRKAEYARRLQCTFFLESEIAEAKVIKRLAPTTMILTTNSGTKFGRI